MKRTLTTALMVLLWIVMALILTVSAVLICSVRLLKPEHLTPLVENFANKALDADVSLGRVELSFRPAFPILNLQVDSLSIISHAFDDLTPESRSLLPVYSDTLFVLDHFNGAVDLGALLTKGEIRICDVELTHPGLNIVLDSTGRGNFDIYQSDNDTTESTTTTIPPFSISRFAFIEPREIRYFNAADSTGATVMLLHDVVLDGSDIPLYALRIDGHLAGPYPKEFLQSDNLRFGLDGRVRWQPQNPDMLALEEFTVRGAFATAHLSTELRYDSTLTVVNADLEVDPIAVDDLMSLIPDSLRRVYRLDSHTFRCDGSIGLKAQLIKPFVTATDSIPYADINIAMANCSLHYGKADLRRLGFDADIHLRGNDLDSATVSLRRFEAAGPATALNLSGRLNRIASDPEFDARLDGNIQLKQLPPVLSDMAGGFIDGRLNMELNARGRMSMMSQENFHSLDIKGKLRGNNLYYLSNDTAVMTEINRLNVIFGSQARLRDTTSISAPSLAAAISADTATILIDGISITVGNIALGAGVENTGIKHDSTLVVPIGGGLRIGRLNIEGVADSAGVRFRDLAGHVGLRRFHGNRHLPLISADLNIGRMAAGTIDTRFMVNDAKLNTIMYRRPQVVERMKEIKHISDSIHRLRPDLPADSVIRLAIEKRRHIPGQPRRRRVHGQLNDEDMEVLEWGLSKGMHKFFYNWQVDGSLTTRHARLFTPMFPLRNRVSNLDLKFSSDSVELRTVRYRAGRSNLMIHGLISNIRQALTGSSANNSLKVNIDINSDTIDVNQLSAATFAGAAYLQRLNDGRSAAIDLTSGDDSVLDQRLDALVSEQADSVGPMLIPTNIDGRIRLDANNVMYSDLALRNLHGQILVFGGGVNLHDLSAQSDAGSVSLSALYSAPKATEMKFGFGLQLDKFKIERFLKLVPAVDSIMPMIHDFSGIINADIAATVDIDSTMNMVLPTLDAAIKLSGDSLKFIDADTYRMLGKWLRFRDKADNTIKKVSVEFLVRDNQMETFPFSFDIDRYRLGIVGNNDLALNFNYHISVLKSPLPFKFGINVSGNPDKFKVRFGGARYKEGVAAESVSMVDTARVNLIKQIEGVFRRGVQNSRFARIDVKAPVHIGDLEGPDTGLSHADSLALIREGLIPAIPGSGHDSDDNTPMPSESDNTKRNTDAYIKSDGKKD